MKKLTQGLLIATVAFCFGSATIWLFAGDEIIFALKRLGLVNPREINSPFSEIRGRTVRIQPYGSTFDIPESWLIARPISGEPSKNLFFSEQDLSELYSISGGDEEDGEVINSVLPFESCAAHIGDRGWGNHLWNDLQGRVYIIDSKPEEIGIEIETVGLKKARDVFEKALVKSEKRGEWNKHTLDIVDAPTHFILGKDLDFYYRSFEDKTVVFVFLHADPFDQEINGILDSFEWSNKN